MREQQTRRVSRGDSSQTEAAELPRASANAARPVSLFLQNRPTRSGAQVALARLILHPAMRRINPVLVSTREGWLTQECKKYGVSSLIVPFPKSRSLLGRLLGNRAFARRVLRAGLAQGMNPVLVQGNDHLEGLLARAVMAEARIPGVIFLRSSETTSRDFLKYQCDGFDLTYAVGQELTEKARQWSPRARVLTLHDGINEADFFPPKTKMTDFPRRILVVGSESHYKGWADLAQAVDLLEEDDGFPALTFDFTGNAPEPRLNDMHLERRRRATFNFIGRSEKFAELVRQYHLVIHPSREESFGMAPIEILAAGVQLLSSRVGVIEKIRKRSEWMFAPRRPEELAERIRFLHDHWAEIIVDTGDCQEEIRKRFMMDCLVADILSEFEALFTDLTLRTHRS
jgi:glycosyltransferase involved in cell wall biosynthesis